MKRMICQNNMSVKGEVNAKHNQEPVYRKTCEKECAKATMSLSRRNEINTVLVVHTRRRNTLRKNYLMICHLENRAVTFKYNKLYSKLKT